jgi:uncharacterized phage-associated protein
VDTMNALDVANEIIRVAHETGKSISNMKLQKLLYLTQGIHLALKSDTPLFDDSIEAWKYGPVVPSVYHKFKIYFSGDIPKNHPFTGDSVEFNSDQKKIIARVVELYGGLSAIKLSNFTHLEESPWFEIYNANSFSAEIPISSISTYFKSWIAKSKQKAG